MARKVRRVRRPKPSVKNAAAQSAEHQDLTDEEELRLEYAYVLQDLRRVFILAAIMFALLIVLNLLI